MGSGGRDLQMLLSKHSAPQHLSLGRVKKPRGGHDSGSEFWGLNPWPSLRGRQRLMPGSPGLMQHSPSLQVGILTHLPPTHSTLPFFHRTTPTHMRKRKNKVVSYPHEVCCVMLTLIDEQDGEPMKSTHGTWVYEPGRTWQR